MTFQPVECLYESDYHACPCVYIMKAIRYSQGRGTESRSQAPDLLQRRSVSLQRCGDVWARCLAPRASQQGSCNLSVCISQSKNARCHESRIPTMMQNWVMPLTACSFQFDLASRRSFVAANRTITKMPAIPTMKKKSEGRRVKWSRME